MTGHGADDPRDVKPPHPETQPFEAPASGAAAAFEGGRAEPRPPQAPSEKPAQFRRRKRDVHGWLVLDKPVGVTSTHAVAIAKRIFAAKKAGHAGTLDPLASGLLPIALGEATKTVPFVMEGRKSYRYAVQWGTETDTDDAEGRVTATSEVRPEPSAIEAAIPAFLGAIQQVPPRYSAIKIAGERAYDLARGGAEVELEARTVEIDGLRLVAHDTTPEGALVSTFEAECGKGTYVRALARDMGRMLGCLGHVVALRRTRVGPFAEAHAVPLAELEARAEADARGLADAPEAPFSRAFPNADETLQPVATALAELPGLEVDRSQAGRLRRGQSVLLRGRDAPASGGPYRVTSGGELIAIASVDNGELTARRVFNLR